MLKKSIVATSVAVLLTACGSDSSSSETPIVSGFTVTGFDGYLQNAVVFIDKDGSASFNTGDELLGLTDSKGQINLDSAPTEAVSLQTLVVGESAHTYLVSLDSQYANIYTMDADRPSQPLDKEYVLQTTVGEKVVSPLTDLVVLEMASAPDKETAIANVQGALGLNADDDLFVDFVEGAHADPKLHKTAQVLADSKAESPAAYQQDPTGFAEDAAQLVASIPAEKLDDPNYRQVVDGDVTSSEPVPTGSATYVNPEVFSAVQAQLDSLDLEWGRSVGIPETLLEADITHLFKDADTEEPLVELLRINNVSSNYVVLDQYNEKTGVVAYINQGKLRIGMNSTDALVKVGTFTIEVEFSSEVADTNSQTALFSFEIQATDETPPLVNNRTFERLQAQVYDWELYQGSPIDGSYTVDLSNLFQDHGKDLELSLVDGANLNGLAVTLEDKILTVVGTPDATADKDALSINVGAKSGDLDAAVTFNLPATEASPSDISVLEDKLLYRAVINTPANIRKCEVIKLSGGTIYSTLGDNKASCPTDEPTDVVGSYNIVDNRLVPFSGKYPEDGAVHRTLLANLSTYDNSDRVDVGRYLVTQGVHPTPENSAIEYYDYARYVENIVKETDAGSWYATIATSTMKIDGSFESLNVLMSSNRRLNIQGTYLAQTDTYMDVTCSDVTNYYEKLSVARIVAGEYQKLATYSVEDICVQYDYSNSSTTVDLSIPEKFDNGVYIFEVTPFDGSKVTPVINRTFHETRS